MLWPGKCSAFRVIIHILECWTSSWLSQLLSPTLWVQTLDISIQLQLWPSLLRSLGLLMTTGASCIVDAFYLKWYQAPMYRQKRYVLTKAFAPKNGRTSQHKLLNYGSKQGLIMLRRWLHTPSYRWRKYELLPVAIYISLCAESYFRRAHRAGMTDLWIWRLLSKMRIQLIPAQLPTRSRYQYFVWPVGTIEWQRNLLNAFAMTLESTVQPICWTYLRRAVLVYAQADAETPLSRQATSAVVEIELFPSTYVTFFGLERIDFSRRGGARQVGLAKYTKMSQNIGATIILLWNLKFSQGLANGTWFHC